MRLLNVTDFPSTRNGRKVHRLTAVSTALAIGVSGASGTFVSVTIPVEKRSAGDASAKSGKSSDEKPKSVIRTSTLPSGLLRPRGVRAEVQRKWRHSRE